MSIAWFRVRTGQIIDQSSEGHNGYGVPIAAESVAFSPDSKSIAMVIFGDLGILDVRTHKFRCWTPSDGVVRYGPDGSLVLGRMRGRRSLLNADTCALSAPLLDDAGAGFSAEFSKSGRYIVASGSGGRVSVWRREQSEYRRLLVLEDADTLFGDGFVISEDENTLFASGTHIRSWALPSGKSEQTVVFNQQVLRTTRLADRGLSIIDAFANTWSVTSWNFDGPPRSTAIETEKDGDWILGGHEQGFLVRTKSGLFLDSGETCAFGKGA